MKKFKKSVSLLLLVCLLLVGSTAAFAKNTKKDGDVSVQIANITNSLTLPSTIAPGSTVNFKAQTVFSWVWEPNPYSTSFDISFDYLNFQKPVVTGYTTPTGTADFYYLSNDSFRGGSSWAYRSGSFWAWPSETHFIEGTIKAESFASGTVANKVGQIDWFWDSHGATATINTTFE